MASSTTCGPLQGLRIVEFAGIGPGPFAGMLLADMGADVVRIDRPNSRPATPDRPDMRSRRRIELDLKSPASVDLCLRLAEKAEVIFEGYRPGVMERLGLGPDALLARNPALVYGRMTGWGQTGPYAPWAGHDMNYLAITGALHAIGTAEKPVPPLNLAADYGGGSMFLVVGILAALTYARATGRGQVVDAAMSDGGAYLMNPFYGQLAAKTWVDNRASNMLDGGAHFYDTYQCSDGHWISLGPIEPRFYALLLDQLDARDKLTKPQHDQDSWPEMKAIIAEIIATKTRAEWSAIMEYTDVCFGPVMSLTDAPEHPHNVARQTFIEVGGVIQAAPAPRFSATPSKVQSPPAPPIDLAEALESWGITP
jgi:alpha-methylacyl-CoA racemase